MTARRLLPLTAALGLALAAPAWAQEAKLLPVVASQADGRILITLPAADKDGVAGRYILATSLRTGSFLEGEWMDFDLR